MNVRGAWSLGEEANRLRIPIHSTPEGLLKLLSCPPPEQLRSLKPELGPDHLLAGLTTSPGGADAATVRTTLRPLFGRERRTIFQSCILNPGARVYMYEYTHM